MQSEETQTGEKVDIEELLSSHAELKQECSNLKANRDRLYDSLNSQSDEEMPFDTLENLDSKYSCLLYTSPSPRD